MSSFLAGVRTRKCGKQIWRKVEGNTQKGDGSENLSVTEKSLCKTKDNGILTDVVTIANHCVMLKYSKFTKHSVFSTMLFEIITF